MTHSHSKSNKQFYGIDIASKKYDACYPDGSLKVFSNNAKGHAKLVKTLSSIDEVILAMEPSGGYEQELIYYLQDKGFKVALCSGFKVNNYAKALGYNAKNDAIDSNVIKQFAQDLYGKGMLPILSVKSIGFRKLENWLNRRAQVTKMLTSEKQRLAKSQDNYITKMINKTIKSMQKDIKLIDKKIEELSKNEELQSNTKRHKEVIGIGDACANGLSIYLPELGHYSNKAIAAIVGVAPYCKESGKHKGKSKIKGGRHKLRSLLYMGVLSAIKHNKVISEFYYRLKAKGKPHNVAMIACMRKMLCILNAMARNNTKWDVDYCSSKI